MIANQNTNAPAAELPRYRSHKIVRALKIKAIEQAPADQERLHSGGDWMLIPQEAGFAPICVPHYDYVVRHKPQVGGYFVMYEDGYKSYSPAAAFEEGYTRIEEAPRLNPADDKLQPAAAGPGSIKRIPTWPFPDGSAT